MRRLALRWLFGVSASIALLGFGVPWISFHDEHLLTFGAAIQIDLVACVVWLAILAYAAFAHRWRALWILTGAPILFWWPYVAASIVTACRANIASCP